MAYQLYRNTTLGNSLQESLDELIQSQQITPQLALQVLLQFDKAINSALAQRVRNRVNFRIFIPLFHKSACVCLATFPEELLRFQTPETLSAGLKAFITLLPAGLQQTSSILSPESLQIAFVQLGGAYGRDKRFQYIETKERMHRFCDNVWTFVLNDVEFREVTELIKVDKVKIVACDGKNTGSNTTE